MEEPFWFPKETFSEQLLKEPFSWCEEHFNYLKQRTPLAVEGLLSGCKNILGKICIDMILLLFIVR